jgi:sodium/hydrogen antiporter
VEHFATVVALVGIVIIVASLLSATLERTGAPLAAVFLALGAALGQWGLGLVHIGLDSPVLRILATLALTLVLFSDAVTMETAEVRARWRLAWRLLGPGTLVPAALITYAAWLLLDVTLPEAAILGAALASTDPVLLRTILRSKTVPITTRIALRLETGMNDVVLLPIIALSMLLLQGAGSGSAVTTYEIGRSFLGLFLLGPALGALVGWLGITMLVDVRKRWGVRRDYESLYALGLAFTGYAAAEAVGGSGFLAAFAAGFVVAAQDVELCDCFLEYGEATAEMLLLLTFVALGTSLIWTGLTVADGRTLVFAAVALSTRTVVLYPMLARAGVDVRDRRLIALFGPRGLSSLLFTLLPVFAGIRGAERLFTVVCLVVLLSVLIHGSGIALFLRANAPATRSDVPHRDATSGEPPAAGAEHWPETEVPLRITIDELRELWARGEPVVLVDVRADRSYRADDLQAAGALRLPPDDPVRSAAQRRLSQHATLVLYCA